MSTHVPETHVITEENVDELVERKDEFVFKPMHGFAGRGLLESDTVGRRRLRRLLRKGQAYVAQKKVSETRDDHAGNREAAALDGPAGLGIPWRAVLALRARIDAS